MVLSINVHYHWKDVKEVIKIVCCNLCMFDMCICNASTLIMFWKMKKTGWTILEVNVNERIIKWIKDHYNSSFIKVEMSIFMMIMTWKKIIKICIWYWNIFQSLRSIVITLQLVRIKFIFISKNASVQFWLRIMFGCHATQFT